MLRAVSSIYIESQAFELFATYRRDVFKLFRTTSAVPLSHQTVLTNDAAGTGLSRGTAPPPSAGRPPPPSGRPPPPSPPPVRRAWTVAAAALALTASIGGVYFYRKLNDEDKAPVIPEKSRDDTPAPAASAPSVEPPYPASAAELPEYVEYLLVGGGTASFAAMRAIRSARPTAQVLIVGEEPALPYMRPPLSKELWREPDVAAAARLEEATFRQWNGKRRPLVYEPAAFYASPAELRVGGAGGAAVARGWRVRRLVPEERRAELEAGDGQAATLRYGRALLATGARARHVRALSRARAQAAGSVRALRSADDAAGLARALAALPARGSLLVLGAGLLGAELSAALGAQGGARVTLACRGEAPLRKLLPPYLAADAARALEAAGVTLVPNVEVVDSEVKDGVVHLLLANGEQLKADLVVECVGSEPADEVAVASGLEVHPDLGGVVVNAEMAARSDVFAAGDVACWYDERLGRRRVEHHDHAVHSGRLAGQNMAALAPPAAYTHQSMFWSDLGPDLGYEAIGIIDSSLRTVGVFSADAVTAAAPRSLQATAGVSDPGVNVSEPSAVVVSPSADVPDPSGVMSPSADMADPSSRHYSRGVVLYLRDERVVGVLLWNLFNRMHVARQVLAQGYFEDLFEAAKLFSLHDDD